MSQQDVYAFLKDNPDRWFTSRDIGNMLDVSFGSVTISLKRLRESDEVRYRRISGRAGSPYLYQFKD